MPFHYPNVSPFATKRRSGARRHSPSQGFRKFEMEHLPDDLLRIILAFSAPTVGARQLAARARTLDEEVEFRPSNEPENYPSDWTDRRNHIAGRSAMGC